MSKRDLTQEALDMEKYEAETDANYFYNNLQREIELVKASLKESPSGGPNTYYDFPYSEWRTTNDQMEYLAEHKWGRYGIHLKDIFKGLCRWDTKSGTTAEYDTKKIIYYGVRVLRMIIGNTKTREYLQELLDNHQFKD